MSTPQTHQTLDQMLNFSERVGTVPPERNPMKRALDILLHAHTVWPQIAREEGGLKEAFLPYGVVVGFVPMLVGSVLGAGLWGTLLSFYGAGAAVQSMPSEIISLIVHFAYQIIGMLIAAKVVEIVAPSFGLRKSWVLSARALVYGATPMYLAGLVAWIPLLGGFVMMVSLLWSCLLTFRGLGALLKKEKPVPAPKSTPGLTVSDTRKVDPQPIELVNV